MYPSDCFDLKILPGRAVVHLKHFSPSSLRTRPELSVVSGELQTV